MALKKSELYSSLWSSCDALRGGMDASQYKDYVLSLLFIKYISDKYAGQPFSAIKIPDGADFAAMVALKGKPDIGDQINKKIIAPLAAANEQLSQSDFPDFNDAVKLGDGKEKVDRLTNLVAIFEGKALDFSKNRAENDDILGDAYEYLMRHFATESGKSKGQFYTPSEVSRIMAKILGISEADTDSSTTVYDPTCGSGSLLLKVADEAPTEVSLYGQEKDATTSGLARMNMILHNNPTAVIIQGNTLSTPKFLGSESGQGDALKQFDYVVANPPFSDKRWTLGLNPLEDPHDRFDSFGVPPAKQGDYAYLLHIVRSLKSTATGACILPHGVLFRGNAEADIRRNLIRKGYIKGIIGLPANLFYGTGIPACIVVVDKQDAAARKGIFMVDASDGFMKDGPKNRLRAQDIHKIVDVFTRQEELPGYSKIVSFEEIEKNEYNLNLPRYIDSREAEDIHDIAGHLYGGVPAADIESLSDYWQVCTNLKDTLFTPHVPSPLEASNTDSQIPSPPEEERARVRGQRFDLAVDKTQIKETIHNHPEFAAFTDQMNQHFDEWQRRTAKQLTALQPECKPKELIEQLSEDLLAHYISDSAISRNALASGSRDEAVSGPPASALSLIDAYDIYQHLMDYWAEVMQDDVYHISAEGWTAETYRILVKDNRGREKDKGWACDLVPKSLIVARYFADQQAAIDELESQLENVTAQETDLEEEHSGEDGLLVELEKINKSTVTARVKELKNEQKSLLNGEPQGASPRAEEDDEANELALLNQWLDLNKQESSLKKQIKEAEAALDEAAYGKYPELNEEEIKSLVVDGKWLARLDADVHAEMSRVSQCLTGRVMELAERYETPMPRLCEISTTLEGRVAEHLGRMGFGSLIDQNLAEVGV